MARIKIHYTKESQPIIEKILLDPYEICPIENCGFHEGCAGKQEKRDNEFKCHLEELSKLFKKTKKENGGTIMITGLGIDDLYESLYEGMKVERIKNIRNNNTEGVVMAIFTVSGTIHVKYKNGNIGRFCNPSHFKIIKGKNPISLP